MRTDRDPVTLGYELCHAQTRRLATNFRLGIGLLPPDRRRALSAVYWFSHRADQAADGAGSLSERAARLAAVRADLERTLGGEPPAPPWTALLDATTRYGIATQLFQELVAGVGRDLEPARFSDWDATLEYCYGVAGVVGLMSLAIFGGRGEEAERAAIELGHALQITNILRDVREDARRGRWYLPLDLSDRFGVTPEAVAEGVPGPGFEALLRAAAEVARRNYAALPRLTRCLPRATRACPAALAGVYRGILECVAADPRATLRGRVGLPAAAKTGRALRTALRALIA